MLGGWATGAWTVESQKEKLNKVYSATYAKSPSMETSWATLETLEDEFFLQVLTGDASIEDFEEFVDQWNKLGGETVTKEIKDIVKSN